MENILKNREKNNLLRNNNLLFVSLLIFISFFVYFNSLSGDFIIDDITRIQNNQNIHNLGNYFSQHFRWDLDSFHEAVLALLWHVSSGSPLGFHLYNIILHSLCVILAYALCLVLFKHKILSFFSALIFAVHPIHTEAVSWISGSPYLESALFYLAIFVCYLKARQCSCRKYYLLCIVLFFPGLLFAKEVFMVPFMIIAYELFFGKGRFFDFKRRQTWIILFLLICIAVISLVVLLSVYLSRASYAHLIFYFRGWSYLVVAIKAFAYYLKILYLPLARGLYHPFAFTTVNIQSFSPLFFVSLFIIALLVFVFFGFRKRLKPVSFGIMWFFVAYLPYSNFIPVCNIISERYLYLSSLGFCIALAALFLNAWQIINNNIKYRRVLRWLALVVITLFLSAYTVLTIRRNYDYNDIITYWQTNINNFPDGYIVYNNLAGTFYAMGDLDNALTYCYTTLMVNSQQPHVWCNLGRIYRERKNFKEAEFCYQQALKIDKDYLPAIRALKALKAYNE